MAEALRVAPSKVSRSLALLDLPEEVQASVDAGELAARSAYELSKLADRPAQQTVAQTAAGGKLTHEQTAAVVRQRRGKPRPTPRGTKQTFFAEGGWKVIVSAAKKGSYHDVEQALTQALAEVRHYIANGRHRPDPTTQETTPLESAAAQIATIKDVLRQATSGLTELAGALKQAKAEQKSTEKEIRQVRSTIRTLQKVDL